jgi:hypothetical protein
MPRHDKVRSDQTATWADQTFDERRGDPERWVGHHLEETARETEIRRVGANDGDIALIEPIPQVGGALWMRLNSHNARTGRDERAGYRSGSRTDIENEVTGNDAGPCNEAARKRLSNMLCEFWDARTWPVF